MGDGSAADAGYFDHLYADSDDPWSLETRFYERRKRAILMASLPRERFARAYEPGCATGVLTVDLAERCDAVVACDVAGRAVEQTAARTRRSGNVEVAQRRFPDQPPAGRFDLVVLSEVGYYTPDLALLVAAVDAALGDDGILVACHWRHRADDHPHTAEQVHTALEAGRHRLVHHSEADFVLDVWGLDGRSVAQRDGIVAADS